MKMSTGRLDYFGMPVVTQLRTRQIEKASGISARVRDIDKALRVLRSTVHSIVRKTA